MNTRKQIKRLKDRVEQLEHPTITLDADTIVSNLSGPLQLLKTVESATDMWVEFKDTKPSLDQQQRLDDGIDEITLIFTFGGIDEAGRGRRDLFKIGSTDSRDPIGTEKVEVLKTHNSSPMSASEVDSPAPVTSVGDGADSAGGSSSYGARQTVDGVAIGAMQLDTEDVKLIVEALVDVGRDDEWSGRPIALDSASAKAACHALADMFDNKQIWMVNA